MRLPDKAELLRKSAATLSAIYDHLYAVPSLSLNDLPPERTALIMMDIINGFAKDGILHSPRIEVLVDGIVSLAGACIARKIPCWCMGDAHTEKSPELLSYPYHCLIGTEETEMVDELKAFGDRILYLPKNSTNGFLEAPFKQWLDGHPEIDHFIVVGDCTDICVFHFSTTVKSWFNLHDRFSRVVVPMDLVDTFDGSLHDPDLLNAVMLLSIEGNGIELAASITQ